MKTLVTWLFLTISYAAFSQQILNKKLNGSEKGKILSIYLREIERNSGNKFFFLDQWFESLQFEDGYAGMTLEEALKKILQGTDISYTTFYNYAVVFAKDPNRTLEKIKFLQSVKSEKIKVESKSLGSKDKVKTGTPVHLSGTVRDGKTLDPLQGASVYIEGTNRVATTSGTGTFSLEIPAGEHFVVFRYSNYEEKIVNLSIYESGEANAELMETPKILEEVVVTGRQSNVVNSNVGQIDLKMAQLKKLPVFLGEIDIIKQIQVLPGVTSVGEMSSGFNVRGGGVDQNLVLYDGVQIFNNSHVFGFFSAFNSEAVRNASFFKGGIPAEFGGRISSVLNISSKEGDYKKWSASGGIGPISSNISFNGPINKEKTSVFGSFRSSYSDWLVKTLQYKDINKSSVWFYDASLKLSHRFSENDKLTFSGYASQDKFGLPSDTTFWWQNRVASLHYDHRFNDRAFSTFTMGFGEYSYDVKDKNKNSAYDLKYGLSYPTMKGDFNYHMGKHRINTGINGIWYGITPGAIVPTSSQSNVKSQTINKEHSLESAVFLSDEFEVTENLRIDGGVRISSFTSMGPGKVYFYQPNQPISNATIIDSVSYAGGKTIKNYMGYEPRFSLIYKVTPFSSLKIGYNRIYQYIHLISNSVSITPIDIWQSSNYYFKPQIGDQYSAGYFRSNKSGKYDFSVEGFYKYIDNILDFKDGSSIVLNPTLENALLRGVGKAYGVEFSINKNSGRLQGSLNYTYARSWRKIQSPFDGESINSGNWYPSNYDQPNVVNFTWRYALSRRFSFTGNFTYRTGRPITLPYSYANINNIPIVNYSDRNEYRVPDYHRLDFALVIEGNHRRKKLIDGSWIISFYNVYARKNVYSVFYKTNDNGIQTPYKLSIIGTILPSISYRFKI
ncbi:MAG: TonB-dependent receptor [Bacteroidetes bacterium]|nr:TonB-dependent receptor [Bacteroidota bacterium]MBI3482045.1 TonB-dependent receptor [Bacteroidota bacterium]